MTPKKQQEWLRDITMLAQKASTEPDLTLFATPVAMVSSPFLYRSFTLTTNLTLFPRTPARLFLFRHPQHQLLLRPLLLPQQQQAQSHPVLHQPLPRIKAEPIRLTPFHPINSEKALYLQEMLVTALSHLFSIVDRVAWYLTVVWVLVQSVQMFATPLPSL